ncbi:MAG: ROK family protein [Pseudonocardiales bacterium]|nr:ROK family protein [Pseudonocardiales bacterium]MBV9031280.1 ROK family protein [Pseudonocardiales bacterium]
MTSVRLGAVELGGTKVICLVGSDPGHIVAQTRIATGKPAETLAQVLAFLQREVSRGGPLAAIGIASFGPLELRRSHPRHGFITRSPKPGWAYVDVVGPARRALGVPVGFDTDVNAAALGEGRWGAARGLDTFVYLTVGTGIGAGAVVQGRIIHGLGHPEMGHLSVPHQPGDHFTGQCPFHGDCWEGMASGAAVAARWDRPAEQLDGDTLRAAARLEAGYLAAGLRNIVYTIAPQRIVIGGSVTALPELFPLVRADLREALAGYPGLGEHGAEDFVVPPALGPLAGPAGALVLAHRAMAT